MFLSQSLALVWAFGVPFQFRVQGRCAGVGGVGVL